MKKTFFSLSLFTLIFLFGCVKDSDLETETTLSPSFTTEVNGTASQRSSEGYPWQNHDAPFDFLFGNHIDTHQQTKELGNNQLQGFFYIIFNGNEKEGVPVATHGNCNMKPDDCTVGWKLRGIPVQATLIDDHGDHGEGQHHPTWCIDEDDMPNQPGYTHFHWLGQPEHPGGLTEGDTYDGYILKLTATKTFFFKHHGGFLVTPGIDYETHANVVTECD